MGNTSLIVGVTVGVVLLLLLGATGLWAIHRRRRRRLYGAQLSDASNPLFDRGRIQNSVVRPNRKQLVFYTDLSNNERRLTTSTLAPADSDSLPSDSCELVWKVFKFDAGFPARHTVIWYSEYALKPSESSVHHSHVFIAGPALVSWFKMKITLYPTERRHKSLRWTIRAILVISLEGSRCAYNYSFQQLRHAEANIALCCGQLPTFDVFSCLLVRDAQDDTPAKEKRSNVVRLPSCRQSQPFRASDKPRFLLKDQAGRPKPINMEDTARVRESDASLTIAHIPYRRQCSSCTRTRRADQCLNKTESPIPKVLGVKPMGNYSFIPLIAHSIFPSTPVPYSNYHYVHFTYHLTWLLFTKLKQSRKVANAAQLEIESLLDLSGGYEERRKRRRIRTRQQRSDAYQLNFNPNTNRGLSIMGAGHSTPLSGFLDLLLDQIGAANESGDVPAQEYGVYRASVLRCGL
ncbi:hypothetical protein B0H16DRAFT_1703385 [Mycena metata]|uniref:Uncharacterized protein n=1 Tax=Mycena metata TaxID=1033252 RepID=A0AAD7H4E5_9AGAR|nr:hypothetical protein B0H16DRAFT_1703385 [Mycena metata]